MPAWAGLDAPGDGGGDGAGPGIVSITRAGDELSVICEERSVPAGIERSGGWRAMRVAGTLEHSMVGVLAALAAPLAAAEIPIFVTSTFDTDYLMVQGASLADAEAALAGAGHELSPVGR